MTLLRRIARWILGTWLLRRGLQIGRKPPPGQDDSQTIEYDAETRRAWENIVLAAMGATVVSAAGFIVFYVVYPDTQLLGLCLGLALFFLGVGLAGTANRVLPQETASEERHDFGDQEVQEEVDALVKKSGEGVSRRGLLIGAGGAAGATLGAAALVPAASLGPSVGANIRTTPWVPGRRVVDSEGKPYLAEEIEEGAWHTGFPEGASRTELGSPVILLRLAMDEIELSDEVKRETIAEGVIVFSKICTHAGCAISTYRYPKYEPTQAPPALVCPCHYSTFDVRRGGEVIFGPAGRDLPRLPVGTNRAGEIVAKGDFLDRIGPSYGGVRKGRRPYGSES